MKLKNNQEFNKILKHILEPKLLYNIDLGHYIEINRQDKILQKLEELNIDIKDLLKK